MTVSFWRAAACGLALIVVAPACAAPAPETVAGSLVAAVAATGEATLAYDSVSGSGSTVTLTNVRFTSTGGSVASAPALVITGAAERQPGGFTAASMTLDNGTATSRGDTTMWATASLQDVVVPTADEVKARAHVRPFGKAVAAGISFSGADVAAPIAIASVSAGVGDVAANTPSNILVHATGVKLPAALITSSVAGAIVGMLDYKEVLVDMTMDSEYDTAADTVTVHLFTLESAGIGKITIAGKASGLSLKGLTDPAKAKDARAAARLDSLKVRLDNAGFVERLLDMQAQMLGGTRDDVRSQLVDGALPFAMSFVKNAAFRDQFKAAVAVFLQDPHSLTITFAPEKPVPLGEVVRTAAHSPTGLPDLLSPSVEVNN